eukprot:SAG31_NODE_3251_length_4490_cov_2.556821_5_plen_141_part_00
MAMATFTWRALVMAAAMVSHYGSIVRSLLVQQLNLESGQCGPIFALHVGHTIRKLTAGPGSRLETIAGRAGQAGYNHDNIETAVSCRDALFCDPAGIALADDVGVLFVADRGNNCIRRVRVRFACISVQCAHSLVHCTRT